MIWQAYEYLIATYKFQLHLQDDYQRFENQAPGT